MYNCISALTNPVQCLFSGISNTIVFGLETYQFLFLCFRFICPALALVLTTIAFESAWYLGQIIQVTSPENAVIKYIKRVGHSDFQWPDPPDQKETSALYLIQNDITITPRDSGLRIWKVSSSSDIDDKFKLYKAQSMDRGVRRGGPRGALAPPPPTYTDRPKLKQLRHTLVWLVSLFGGSRAPSPAGSSLPVPVSISQQQLMNKMFQNMTLFVPSTIVIRTHSQMARPLSLGVVCKSGSGSVTIVT